MILPQYTIAVFVDGPNILSGEQGIRIRTIDKIVAKYGTPVIRNSYSNSNVPRKMVEALVNDGYQVRMCPYGDIDPYLVADATEIIVTRPDISLVALATRDSDVLPVVYKARDYGKKTLVLAPQTHLSAALRSAATFYEILEKSGNTDKA